jgi:Flp pilus assembly protein TadB
MNTRGVLSRFGAYRWLIGHGGCIIIVIIVIITIIITIIIIIIIVVIIIVVVVVAITVHHHPHLLGRERLPSAQDSAVELGHVVPRVQQPRVEQPY